MNRLIQWLQLKLFGRSDIYFGASVYMRRWRIGPKWSIGLRLHHIVRGDGDRELHDHPFTFLSIILWGGYWEHRPAQHGPFGQVLNATMKALGDKGLDTVRTWHGPLSCVFRRAEDLHRLELDRPAWTLVIRGPIYRTWGFMTDTGWVPWHNFVAQREASLGALGEPGAFAAPSSLGMAQTKEQR